MKERSASKISLTSLDELLGGTGAVTAPGNAGRDVEGQVVRIPLDKMVEFKGHPFRVLDDEKMAETVESVQKHGVLMPGIVRPHKTLFGMYEIIAGHRRRRASKLAGLPDMPVIVMNLSDDEATVIMVDSNIQREDLLYSERAWAYRMKYDAQKRLGCEGGRSDSVLAKESGESRNTIQRYIRLTYLVPELLQLVDERKLPWITAAEYLSHLKSSEQLKLFRLMGELKAVPSGEQARTLKEFSKKGELTDSVMAYVLERKEDMSKVSLPGRKIRSYFPEGYTGKQIEAVIYELLEEWKSRGVE